MWACACSQRAERESSRYIRCRIGPLIHRLQPVSIAISTILAFTNYRLVIWFNGGFFLPGEIAKVTAHHWLAQVAAVIAGYLILKYASAVGINYKFTSSRWSRIYRLFSALQGRLGQPCTNSAIIGFMSSQIG